MKKRTAKKLPLARETIRNLKSSDARKVAAANSDEIFSCESGCPRCINTGVSELCATQ